MTIVTDRIVVRAGQSIEAEDGAEPLPFEL